MLAEQFRLYNTIAPSLWPDNKVVNQSAAVEGLESGKFWYISPDGQTRSLSKNEALSYNFARNAFVGTYDSILFLTHERFHLKQQVKPKWQKVSGTVPNEGRAEFLENTPSRAKRDLLQRQLMKAVSKPGDTRLILDALSTYTDWKNG